MPKMVLIHTDYRETDGVGISRVKFAAGQLYPVDADTERRVALGDGEVVDVADVPAAGAQSEQTAAEAEAAAKAAAEAEAAAKAAAEAGKPKRNA